MIELRKGSERHYVLRRRQQSWLTFGGLDVDDQFAGGFGGLAALNENRLPPGAIVKSPPPLDVEIVTYVLSGALVQNDSTGHSGIIHAGEFHRLTNGRRTRHSERNASQRDGAHVFRMSFRMGEPELDCTSEQRFFSAAEVRGVLCLVASPDGRKGSLRVHQETSIYSSILDPGQHVVHELALGRMAWLHVVRGEAKIGGLVLTTGDGAGITAERAVSLTARERTEILLIDLHETVLRVAGNEAVA